MIERSIDQIKALLKKRPKIREVHRPILGECYRVDTATGWEYISIPEENQKESTQ